MPLKNSISNILIWISAIVTLLAYLYPWFYVFGINNYFLNQWDYIIYFLQFFTWTFLHWGILHLAMNSIFIYYFWNVVELLIWKKNFLYFFIFSTIIIWVAVTNLSDWNTVWISWFAMAILTYYTLELKRRNNPEYKWWITAIIINVWIWFSATISLYWHLFWVVAGLLYYLLNKTYLKKKMVWLSEL